MQLPIDFHVKIRILRSTNQIRSLLPNQHCTVIQSEIYSKQPIVVDQEVDPHYLLKCVWYLDQAEGICREVRDVLARPSSSFVCLCRYSVLVMNCVLVTYFRDIIIVTFPGGRTVGRNYIK